MSAAPKQLLSEKLEKGLQILSLFDEYHRGLTLTQISTMLGINKTSIYRYLNTYCKLGYLRKGPQTKLFRLGPQTVALAHSFLQGSDLVDLVKPVVDRAYSQYRLSIDVGLLHEDSFYLVYRQKGRDTVNFHRITSAKGLHFISTGKVALAFLPEDERLRSVENLRLDKRTGKTITDKTTLIAELEKTYARGYALNDEEYLPGLIALGAPLINLHTSKVQGAVSIMSNTTRYSIERFEAKYADIIVELAKEISALLPAL